MQVAGAPFSRNMWKSLASGVAISPSLETLVTGGVLHCHANLEPYNTGHLFAFLGDLQDCMAAISKQCLLYTS